MVQLSRKGIQLPFYTSSVAVHADISKKRNQSGTNGPSFSENVSKSPHRVASVPTLICSPSCSDSRVPLKKRMKRAESSVFTLREPRRESNLNSKSNGSNTVKPEECFERIVRKSGTSTSSINIDAGSFLSIQEQQLPSYPQAALAARNEDLQLLKKLHAEGHNLQCSNKFGESIIHIICRRGRDDILDFLVSEVNVSLRLRDDLGRTPLHDAAWTERPNFKVVHRLLLHEPDMIFVRDNRGNSPLAYIPRQNWGVWNQFLKENQACFSVALK